MWGIRAAAVLLGMIGLAPLLWAGVGNGGHGVLQLAILDPISLIAVCAFAAWAAPDRVASGLAALRRLILKPSDGLFSFWIFAWVVLLGSVLAWYCFGGKPVLTDEFTQAFQGRLLLAGRLAAHGEAHREFFESSQTVDIAGRWFSEYPIGGGVMAAIGDMLRLPWIINPVLAGLGGIALFRFARTAYGATTGRVSAVLYALSPFVLFMTGNRMNHTATLAAVLLALGALAVWTEANEPKVRHLAAAVIGLGIGLMVALRPYDAVLIAVPIGVFQLFAIRRSRHLRPTFVTQAIVGLLVVGVQLAVNWKTTGHPMMFGYDALNGPAHRPGFHIDPRGLPFTPRQGLTWIVIYLIDLNSVLFETAIPAVAFAVGALLCLRSASRWDWLLVGVIGAFLMGYGAYWFGGMTLGPRFLLCAAPSFIVLTARFEEAWWTRGGGNQTLRATALLVLPAAVAFAWLPIATSSRQTGVWTRASANAKYFLETPPPDVAGEVRDAKLTNALVFVREPLHRRIAARLEALGMAPYSTVVLIANLDACRLDEGLDASDAMRGVSDSTRMEAALAPARHAGRAQPVAGLIGSQSLALIGGRPSTQACAGEIADDARLGTLEFEPFLARAEFARNGRLGGKVVFARDLGERDSLLRDRFGDRTWYRYSVVSSPAGDRALFTPYK